MPNSTPGPWSLQFDDYGDEIWLGGDGEGMATISSPNNLYDAIAYIGFFRKEEPEQATQREANAKLISAAPDLLEASQLLIKVFNNEIVRQRHNTSCHRILEPWFSRLEAAINKAE